jgi:hypothetical protein
MIETTEQEALECRYVEGYQRKPESPSVGKLGERMAAEAWAAMTWPCGSQATPLTECLGNDTSRRAF